MIALINPNAKVEVVKRLDISTPPLGLGYLASMLREKGLKVRIIDDLVEKLSLSDLLQRIKDALIIGITSTTPTFNTALRYACAIKRRFPHAFIILGGVHATFMPYEALKNDCVDAVCVGEGEYTAGKPVLKNLYLSPEEIMRFLRYCYLRFYLRFYLRPTFILREIKKKRVGIISDLIRMMMRKD